jgi:nucleotide-binding universal stress UspA family protein
MPDRQRQIMVVRDLQGSDLHALDRAGLVASASGRGIAVVEAVRSDASAPGSAERAAVRGLVENRLDASHAQPKLVVEQHVASGAEEIVHLAARLAPDLIVMDAPSTVLLGGLFPSVPEEVAREARIPVLAVKLPARENYAAAIAGVDLTSASAGAIGAATKLGLVDTKRLTVLHTYLPLNETMMTYAGVEPDRIREQASASEARAWEGLRMFVKRLHLEDGFRLEVGRGPAADELLAAADRASADLIILGSRRLGGIARFLAGSTVSDVLARAQCDILIAPGRRS